MIPVLTTERLTLRGPKASDEAAFIAYYTSDRSLHTGGPVLTHRASLMFLAMVGHWAIRGFGMWTVTTRTSDDPIGYIGCFQPAGWPEQELGWVIYDGHEGKSLAFEAASAARDHAFSALNWQTAVSYIAPENHRSIALAQRLGASLDPDAAAPGHSPALVYRHPAPGAPS